LASFAKSEILSIEDVSTFVAEQRAVAARKDWAALITPREQIYTPSEPGSLYA
jgi:hypothetical protein